MDGGPEGLCHLGARMSSPPDPCNIAGVCLPKAAVCSRSNCLFENLRGAHPEPAHSLLVSSTSFFVFPRVLVQGRRGGENRPRLRTSRTRPAGCAYRSPVGSSGYGSIDHVGEREGKIVCTQANNQVRPVMGREPTLTILGDGVCLNYWHSTNTEVKTAVSVPGHPEQNEGSSPARSGRKHFRHPDRRV